MAEHCPICGGDCRSVPGRTFRSISCADCGTFTATPSAEALLARLPAETRRTILAHAIDRAGENHQPSIEIGQMLSDHP